MLLYRKKSLEGYLDQEKVKELLKEFGYSCTSLKEIFSNLPEALSGVSSKKRPFPHEIGFLLGYPPEDVEGFIRNNGQKFLCVGEWKVYENSKAKQKLFPKKYDYTRENLIQLLSCGIRMDQIVSIMGA